MKNKIAPFVFQPFSKKQLQVLTWWMPNSPVKDKDAIICDGSVRAGKTIVMSLSFVIWAMETFDGQNLGMSGKTIGSLRRNVIQVLKQMLKGRGYKVRDHRADNYLTITYKGKSNDFYLFGGKDERSQDLIQGITLAGMLFDEVALMPQSFVNQATARCSIDGAKLWFNCNPDGPYHWFKIEWIDQLKEKNAILLHFTMDDNLSLSDRVRERYKRLYSGIFYKRYIQGLWVLAEGVIYDMFREDEHIKNKLPEKFERYFVGVDYGTSNPCVFLLFGVNDGIYYCLKEYYYDGRKLGIQKSDDEYVDDFVKFLGSIIPSNIYIDPSASSFIVALKKRKIRGIKEADNAVLDGIRTQATLLANRKYYIHESCTNTIEEYGSYLWDAKAQARGEDKPVKKFDHSKDAERYALRGEENKTHVAIDWI